MNEQLSKLEEICVWHQQNRENQRMQFEMVQKRTNKIKDSPILGIDVNSYG